ncbi:MAG: helix-turn-helix domain-containing protein [Pseudomonadota bacterium]
MPAQDDLVHADYTDESATFGDRVTAAREVLGLSLEQLSRPLGVSVDTISDWEADRSEPRANRMQMLAGVLNVSLIWLMTGESDKDELRANVAKDVPQDVLDELRMIRADQMRVSERLAQLMRRLSQ